MKIVILQGAFLPVPPLRGGAVEKIWYKMGKEFAHAGHEVVHISRSYENLATEEINDNVKYIRVKGHNTPASLLKLKLLDLIYSLRAIKKIPRNADVIVTNTFWSPLLLRGKIGKKVYVDVQRVPRGQIRFYQHVGRLRACSPAIRDALKKEINTASLGLVSFIPNPIPFEIKNVSAQREKTILFVGRIHSEKGIHILIDASAALRKILPSDWNLIIVGPHEPKDGGEGVAYLNRLQQQSKNLPVAFLGPQYEEDRLIQYYCKASIFCYPAQDGSGDAAPVAPREAMAYGCVPVVSQLGCFDDFILDGINGIKYDQGVSNQIEELTAALLTLAGNGDLLKKLSEACLKIRTTYSANHIAKKFLTDFKAITGDK